MTEGATVVEDDVSTRLHPYEEAYDALLAVVSDRLSKLQVMMIQSQQLDIALADIVDWLADIEKKQDKQENPVLRTDKIIPLQMEQEVRNIDQKCMCYASHNDIYSRTGSG